MIAPPIGNVPELTVGELSGALKQAIEDRFGLVRVRGEISNYRGPHSSGHAYFCLKDDLARIDAVVWRTTFAKLKVPPQEGLEVIATGRVTTFPGKSTYQIVIDLIEPAGLGALMAMLDARRTALAAEGLFDASRKQSLPLMPRVIGVVTSPTGAVVRDILHRLEDRFPCHVLVWPVRVQGETAAEEIAAAINGFNELPAVGQIPRPRVLIVARGGGSLEDLWAFNEEIVVRAAANSAIPIVSGVGHETDVTLMDHVADLRAPTPTGAAEKVVPVRTELLTQHVDIARRHEAAMLRFLSRRRIDAKALARALPSADRVTATPRQQFDRLEERLLSSAKVDNARRQLNLMSWSHRLSRQSPSRRLAADRHRFETAARGLGASSSHRLDGQRSRLTQSLQRLGNLAPRLKREVGSQRDRRQKYALALGSAWNRLLAKKRDELDRHGKLLETLGYRQILARGFVLVRDASGRPVRTSQAAKGHAMLDIEFADGHIQVSTRGRLPSPTAKRSSSSSESQGSLFQPTPERPD